MLCSGVKRLPSLFTLPYWKVMSMQNTTNVCTCASFLYCMQESEATRREEEMQNAAIMHTGSYGRRCRQWEQK